MTCSFTSTEPKSDINTEIRIKAYGQPLQWGFEQKKIPKGSIKFYVVTTIKPSEKIENQLNFRKF